MNERIQQLYAQAWDIADGKHDQQIFAWSYQKFAELIVKECALTAGLMEHSGRKNIGAQILDSFGVGNEQ